MVWETKINSWIWFRALHVSFCTPYMSVNNSMESIIQWTDCQIWISTQAKLLPSASQTLNTTILLFKKKKIKNAVICVHGKSNIENYQGLCSANY